MTPKKTAVLYVHGIDVTDPAYARPLHRRVAQALRRGHPELSQTDVLDVLFMQGAYWADVFTPSQLCLDASLAHHGLSWEVLRRFMAGSVAQAVGYEGAKTDPGYRGVSERITDALATLSALAGHDTDLIIVAHSLGCMVTTDFIWDMQQAWAVRGDEGLTCLEALHTLRGLVTMGNPEALYASRWPDMGQPIKMGSAGIPWLNLMAASDVIGWPLKTLNPAYALEVQEDKVVNVGVLNSLTPASHTHYWTSDAVAQQIASLVTAVWNEE